MRSIRHHLLLHLLLRAAPLVIAGCVALFLVLRFLLIQQFDSSLRAQTGALASMAERVGDGVDFDYDVEEIPDYLNKPRPGYFELWLSDGVVLQRSASLGKGDLAHPEPSLGTFRVDPIVLPDGRRGRACITSFEPRPVKPEDHEGTITRPNAAPGPVTLIAARGTDEYERPLAALAVGLFGMGVALIGGLVVVIRMSVRYGLSPLDRLGNQVMQIGPSALHERVGVSGLPRELKPIGARLNDLLARLEDAFERERRFAASAAHELRTPVAEVRALAEVAERFPAGGEQSAHNLREIVAVAREMERTIAVLLGIARAKTAGQQPDVVTLDVGKLVQEQWARRSDRAAGRRLAVSLRIDKDLSVESDAGMLSSIVSNLLDNAIDHTQEGGRVLVEALADGQGVLIRVENSGCTLEPHDLARVFDPFWRKERSRSDEGHSGLGLALVRALCDAAGAKVWAEVREGQRFSISVRLARVSPGADRVRSGDPGAELNEPESAGARR